MTKCTCVTSFLCANTDRSPRRQTGGSGAESTPPVTELRVTPAILSNEISVFSRCLSPRSSFIKRDEGPRTRVPADMSYCKQEGKDRIIFVTKEDHETPSNAELIADDPDDPYEEQGLILPNGEINWNCPCLGGMASGPCGSQFKEAFSCFHYSQEEVKGSECIEQFRTMQECMQRYPDLYPQEEDKESPPQAESGGAPAADGSALLSENDSPSVASPDSASAADG
uniref:Coiled-coil-helix-coiled-coil-helix domain containing 4a n=3 Tax=Poecilia TaxID=8080 RepID=A0A3P9PWG9_POERE